MDWGWIVWIAVPVGLVAVGIVGQLTGVMNFKQDGANWRRSAGNVMGPVDGLFAPSRQEAMQEQERQTELPAPAPTPGDPLLDLESGVARIDLRDDR